MNDIFTFINEYGKYGFQAQSFCEADGLTLARASYLPFELVDEKATLGEACGAILNLADIENTLMQKQDIRLLRAFYLYPRYRDCEIYDFVKNTDSATQTQFSALTMRIDENLFCVLFRGTDNTLIGWKEDFNMSFECPVPAQTMAAEYLCAVSKKQKGDIIVAGHSKGGNLAVYASALFDNPERINNVYNFDGPGFDDKILQTKGYKNICEKTRTFVPQSSVVGMLLGHEEEYTIVHSKRKNVLMQHDLYSWETQGDGFCQLDTVTNSSRFIDKTLKQWVSSLDCQHREIFVNAAFEILCETNAQTLHQLSENKLQGAKTVIKALSKLDEETKKSMLQALSVLAKSMKKSFSYILEKQKD